MNIVTAWLVFPAALALLSLGSGLLLERVAGRQLPGVLVLPAGFALVVCVAGLITSSTALAGLAFSVVAVTALAGYVLGASRLRRARPERWAAAAAVAVFLVFGAPAFLTGAPTFSGSLVLPDTSNQLVLGQRLSDAGPDHTSLHPSSYQVSASKYLSSQYPVAAQATLGALAPVGFQEMAWLYQPSPGSSPGGSVGLGCVPACPFWRPNLHWSIPTRCRARSRRLPPLRASG